MCCSLGVGSDCGYQCTSRQFTSRPWGCMVPWCTTASAASGRVRQRSMMSSLNEWVGNALRPCLAPRSIAVPCVTCFHILRLAAMPAFRHGNDLAHLTIHASDVIWNDGLPQSQTWPDPSAWVNTAHIAESPAFHQHGRGKHRGRKSKHSLQGILDIENIPCTGQTRPCTGASC